MTTFIANRAPKLPAALVTAVVGSPFFNWLLWQQRKS